MINTADGIFVSASVGLIGALLLSRAAIFKKIELIRQETATFLGFNPFTLKGTIQQWYDARIGMFLYVLGVILSLVVGVKSLQNTPSKSFVFATYTNLAVSIALSSFAYFITAKISSACAKSMFIAEAKHKMKPSFQQSVFMLENDGLDERRIELPRKIRDDNIKNAKVSIRNTEQLFEMQGVDRLRKFFEV